MSGVKAFMYTIMISSEGYKVPAAVLKLEHSSCRRILEKKTTVKGNKKPTWAFKNSHSYYHASERQREIVCDIVKSEK